MYFYNDNSSKELEIPTNIGRDVHSDFVKVQIAFAVAELSITEKGDSHHVIFSVQEFFICYKGQ